MEEAGVTRGGIRNVGGVGGVPEGGGFFVGCRNGKMGRSRD